MRLRQALELADDVIIYAETQRAFLRDVDENRLQPKLCDAFRRRTGGLPADHKVWADEYSRFSLALQGAKVNDEARVAIEYHLSAAGRFRVDVLLAGNDGKQDHGVIVELKAWDQAGTTDIEGLVLAPVGGGRMRSSPAIFWFSWWAAAMAPVVRRGRRSPSRRPSTGLRLKRATRKSSRTC